MFKLFFGDKVDGWFLWGSWINEKVFVGFSVIDKEKNNGKSS